MSVYTRRHDICCYVCGARGAVYGYSRSGTEGWFCLDHLVIDKGRYGGL